MVRTKVVVALESEENLIRAGMQVSQAADQAIEVRRVSAKANRHSTLSEQEIQAAEEEAEAWARRANSC